MSTGYIACGTFGVVYGSPRLPCEGETYDEIKDKNEISKLFIEENDFKIDSLVIQRIRELVDEDGLEEIKKYFILPVKWGKVNYTDLPVQHYQSEWLKTSPISWMNSKLHDNHYHKDIIYQSVQEKGECCLKTYFDKKFNQSDLTNTNICMFQCVSRFNHLANGISLLHNYGFIHMDIKIQNAVVIHNTFKFIDVGEIFHYDDLSEYFDNEKLHLMTNQFRYWVYSPYVLWSRCFSHSNREGINMKFLCTSLIKHMKVIRDLVFQLIPLYIYLYEFNILGLNEDELKEIYNTLYILFEHESCGLFVEEKHMLGLTFEGLAKIFGNPDVKDNDRKMKEQIRRFYKEGEKRYGGNYTIEERTEKRRDLLKMNDRHGFGIMLLNMFQKWLEHIRSVDTMSNIQLYFQTYKNIRKKMLDIFEIAVLFVVGNDDNVLKMFSESSIPPIFETVQTQ